MFIDRVITKIWEPVTQEYQAAYREAMKKDAQTLFDEHTSMAMKYYPYTGVTMNYINTSGCPYRAAHGQLSGCSMCDYQSEFASKQGSLLALRKKDPKLYAKAISLSFKNCRGENGFPNIIENISGYDSLDYNEIPSELCTELFEKNLFEESPFIYNVEARASSITRERLRDFKKTLSGKKRVSIDFGVEVGNEWLRNEWLNKSIMNKDIINAVSLCHEFGFKAVGNVLLGLPGLTEYQSLKFFVDSVKWMDSVGIDKIVIHVLNRKHYTLHGFIYRTLKEDVDLKEVGLVNGEHTGIPWLFTVILSLAAIQKESPELFSKMVMVKLDEKFNSIHNNIAYNEVSGYSNNKNWIDYLNSLAFSKDYVSLLKIEKELPKDAGWKAYTELIEKQKLAGTPAQTLSLLSQKIAQKVFCNDWKSALGEFYVPADLGADLL